MLQCSFKSKLIYFTFQETSKYDVTIYVRKKKAEKISFIILKHYPDYEEESARGS